MHVAQRPQSALSNLLRPSRDAVGSSKASSWRTVIAVGLLVFVGLEVLLSVGHALGPDVLAWLRSRPVPDDPLPPSSSALLVSGETLLKSASEEDAALVSQMGGFNLRGAMVSVEVHCSQHTNDNSCATWPCANTDACPLDAARSLCVVFSRACEPGWCG